MAAPQASDGMQGPGALLGNTRPRRRAGLPHPAAANAAARLIASMLAMQRLGCQAGTPRRSQTRRWPVPSIPSAHLHLLELSLRHHGAPVFRQAGTRRNGRGWTIVGRESLKELERGPGSVGQVSQTSKRAVQRCKCCLPPLAPAGGQRHRCRTVVATAPSPCARLLCSVLAEGAYTQVVQRQGQGAGTAWLLLGSVRVLGVHRGGAGRQQARHAPAAAATSCVRRSLAPWRGRGWAGVGWRKEYALGRGGKRVPEGRSRRGRRERAAVRATRQREAEGADQRAGTFRHGGGAVCECEGCGQAGSCSCTAGQLQAGRASCRSGLSFVNRGGPLQEVPSGRPAAAGQPSGRPAAAGQPSGRPAAASLPRRCDRWPCPGARPRPARSAREGRRAQAARQQGCAPAGVGRQGAAAGPRVALRQPLARPEAAEGRATARLGQDVAQRVHDADVWVELGGPALQHHGGDLV